MNKKITFSPHIMALTAIFVLGNGVINYPLWGADEFNFTAYLISVLGLAVLYTVFSFLWGGFRINSYSSNSKKVIYSLLVTALSVFALFIGGESFLSLTDFVSKIVLPDTPRFYVSAIFGFAVIYFALKRKENLLKFSLVSAVLVVGVILFFFIAPMDKYDLRNIFIFRLPKLGELLPQIKVYAVNPILHSLILPLYFKFSFGETRTKYGTCGALIGACLLGLCVLSPILLFGANVSGGLDFPFSSAVSTVTVGRLFTRLDGFAYFVYFVSSLIKITVCLSVVLSSLKIINELFGLRGNRG